jgi:hypothetical protein
VAELVEDDEIVAADEGGNRTDVREVAAAEDDGVLGAFERRELALELGVERMVAVDEAGGAGADAETLRGFDARGDDVGVLREAEVVVAGERDEFRAGLKRGRRRRSRRDREAPAKVPPLERCKLVACERVERRSWFSGTR